MNQNGNIEEVYLVGINTDYCVFATAMDSFSNKFRTYIIRDAVTSVRGKAAHEEGLCNFQIFVSAKPGKRTRPCFPGEMQRAIAEEMRREQLRRQYEDGKADIVGNALAV